MPAGPKTEPPQFGPGVIEGTAVAVSAETLERNLCDTGFHNITFDDHGHGIDLGREQRIFSPAQRAALADHLRLHNEHWHITRDDTGRHWLTPPPELGLDQEPIRLTSKNPLLRDTD